MSIETIYFKVPQNDTFEQGMAAMEHYAGCTVTEDRRSFLTTLAEAVGRSEAIITIGQLPLLASVLSRGLGHELSAVDWASLGLETQDDVLLPQGALPLVIDQRVGGMILENAGQCIISVNDEESDLNKLCEQYVLPYLNAIRTSAPVEAEQEEESPIQEESIEETPAPQATLEDVTPEKEPEQPIEEPSDPTDFFTKEPVAQPAAEPTQEQEEELPPPTEEQEPADLPVIEGHVDRIDVKVPLSGTQSIKNIRSVDIFEDMELSDEEIDAIVPPRNFKLLRSFLIFVLVLALLAGGCYYGYDAYLAPNQYDEGYAKAVSAYDNSIEDDDVFHTKHFAYNTKFASLYEINDNVIAWLEVDGLSLRLPVASAASRSENFYNDHIFDKTFNPYGTAYVSGIYDKSNDHVNLVIRGKAKDETRLFGTLDKYLDTSFALEHHTFTVQTVYEQEPTEYEIFAVVSFADEQSPYLSNFTALTATERQEVVAAALEESKVNFSVDTVSYLHDDGTHRYVTLVAEKDGGYLAVMARDIEQSDNAAVTDQPVTGDPE